MPAVEETMNMGRLICLPDDLEVSEIPEPTKRVIEKIQPAPLVRSGYRPSDLEFKKFARIAIRVVFESQHHLPAVDDPFQGRRSDVLPTALLAELQRVGKIREPFLQLRWRHPAVYRRFDLLLT